MALPLPGAPASSWRLFGERLRQSFQGADARVCVAFWLLGLINNVLYVIILSAALDLVGPTVPKGVVLLADVVPSLIAKLFAPYLIHLVPYSVRVWVFAVLSTVGMLVIALTPEGKDGAGVSMKMVGVMLASLSSGGGELTFLGLVHYYGPFSLAAWGSGTGGAGLIGAGAYALATTTLGFSVKRTLVASAFLPAVMLVSFFVILPLGTLYALNPTSGSVERPRLDHNEADDEDEVETEGLLAEGKASHRNRQQASFWAQLRRNLRRSKALFWPFMFPLFLVYMAEYTINQGVAPTLLFPLKETPFDHFRAFYPSYNAVYQAGVFVSRSSTPFFRIHNLYLPSLLQVGNLGLLTAQALLFRLLPSVYLVFLLIFWEGLLGGLVYVNTFAEISDRVAPAAREFSLSATSVSDSAGICLAGFVSMAFEVWLCRWQVQHGRDYCTKL